MSPFRATKKVPVQTVDGSTADAIIAKINAELVEILDVDRNDLRPTARLIEDLNCDELTLIEIAIALEAAFLLDEQIVDSEWSTVADVHTDLCRRLGVEP